MSEGHSGCEAQIQGWVLRRSEPLVVPVPGKDRIPAAVDGGGCLQGEADAKQNPSGSSWNTAQKATLQPKNPEYRLKRQNPTCWKRRPSSPGDQLP